MPLARRGFLIGSSSALLVAPAIVRVSSLMPLSVPRSSGIIGLSHLPGERALWLIGWGEASVHTYTWQASNEPA